MMKYNLRKSGFSLAEVVVTFAVSSFLIGYLLTFSNSLVSSTHKSAAYYQALQLAHETLDWIKTIPPNVIDERFCAAIGGSVTDYGTLKSIELPVNSVNEQEGGKISYPDSYAKSWFLRQIKIKRYEGDKGRFLLKVSAIVSWRENYDAKKNGANYSTSETRSITLTTAIFDEDEYY